MPIGWAGRSETILLIHSWKFRKTDVTIVHR